jgi:23S rRNA pseudouridine1911/1915/1917 synthase
MPVRLPIGVKRFQLNRPEHGWTLQRVLHDRLGFSHASARGLVASGCVHRNGWPQSDAALRANVNDVIEVRYDPLVRYSAPKHPVFKPLVAGDYVAGARVLHLDEALVVVDKPSGLLSVHAPGSTRSDLKRRLDQRLESRLYPVQRLDRYTTGVLAYARSKEAKEALVPQFREHTVRREYLGVVEGVPRPYRSALRVVLVEDRTMKVRLARPGEQGEEAITEYEVLETLGSISLCRFLLHTGKKHQIRVQMAGIGHPLVGDRAYGSPSPEIGRPALHASTLELKHPLTGEWMRWEAPLPDDLRRLIRRRGGAQKPQTPQGRSVRRRGPGRRRDLRSAS